MSTAFIITVPCTPSGLVRLYSWGCFVSICLLDSYQLRCITDVNKGKINLTHYLRNREVNKLLSAIRIC